MRDLILHAVEQAVSAVEQVKQPAALVFIEGVTQELANCFRNGKKVLVAGNGGSLCDAMHFVEELTGQFRERRPALAAIALADPGHMTCVANDFGYDTVFSRSVEALGQPGDLFIGLTTSGNSPNILRAVQMAKEKGMKTIAFLGKTGGSLKGQCDWEWLVTGFRYSDRIQEAHMFVLHMLVELVERELFGKVNLSEVLSLRTSAH